VGDESEGVSVSHGLAGFFGIEGLNEHAVLIELGGEVEAGCEALIFRFGGNTESVGAVESEVSSDSVFASGDALLGGLLDLLCLADLLLLAGHKKYYLLILKNYHLTSA